MILLIDIGNSRSKWVLTNEASGINWQASGQWSNQGFSEAHWLARFKAIKETVSQEFEAKVEAIAISCVANEDVWKLLQNYCEQVFEMLPILPQSSREYRSQQGGRLFNSYKVTEALGVDRWLAMIAGTELTTQAFAVIDAGTAITLDVIDSSGQHLGGHIIPGHRLMQSSLLGDTGRIAWSAQHNRDDQLDSEWLATNTQQAIEQGTLCASVAYLEHLIDKLCHQLQLDVVIVTGGDAEQLISLLNTGFKKYLKYQKDLVLQGLFYWFLDNLTKKTADKANS
ncbi:type III pantothenate kinase [Kangiella koreensis]|uniref:Type III pantothenate kinase n=1 Tax=Kangiella koreensis (strain DSM 16069 / JCM 12317 / KCTC 12182 / SW-125) TaxID=523791 RepID=C7R860_KANKD|nr:type III pantothenate kinase [Kangiella koreensis]ACV25842.1 putative transcriptional acitvator, Baf family [Kangiella koreensis DSM 16069]